MVFGIKQDTVLYAQENTVIYLGFKVTNLNNNLSKILKT